jgi:GAF domain-containing protein
MFSLLKLFLTPPDFGDAEKNRLAGVVNVIVLTQLVGSSLSLLSLLAFKTTDGLPLLLIGVIGGGVGLWLLHRGRLQASAVIVALVIIGTVTLHFLNSNTGIRSNLNIAYFASIVIGGLVFGRRGIIVFTGLCLAVITGLYIAEVQGVLVPAPLAPVGVSDLVTIYLVVGIAAVVLYVLVGQHSISLEKSRQNAEALAETNRQLQTIRTSLEEQVVERTQGLVTVGTINERLIAILDLEQLLAEVVNEVRTRFDYYHAHIYLLDEAQQNLVVAEGTGAAGAELKEKRHSIPINAPASLVARAARSRQIVNIENVRKATDWLPNDLLPDTHSEIAVPIVLDDQVVGVLDVQDDEVAGFDEGDESVLRSLANQVAVAIRNAGLFADVEQALADARAAQRRFLEEAWESAPISEMGGYHLATSRAVSPSDEVIHRRVEQGRQVVVSQKQQTLIRLDDDEAGREMLVAPIKLQDLVVGTLCMQPPAEGGPLQADELAAIEAVLDQFSQMIETMRLTDVNRQRAGQEATIRNITDKLRVAPNLDRLLEIATTELARYLSAEQAELEIGISSQPSATSGQQAEKLKAESRKLLSEE